MSKAFTKESDSSDRLMRAPASAALAPGVKNYMTAGGAKALQEKLAELTDKLRPQLAATRATPEKSERLAVIDEQINLLRSILQTVVIPPALSASDGKIRFGATVLIRNSRGEETTYRIVGVDEVDLDQNWVSWLSPIAKALLNASEGETVPFKFPTGQDRLQILSVKYEDA